MSPELKEAIDEVTDWLNYEVWANEPCLEAAVRHLNGVAMRERTQKMDEFLHKVNGSPAFDLENIALKMRKDT